MPILAAHLPDSLAAQAWQVDFGEDCTPDLDELPPVIGFRSSGTTGRQKVFWRARHQVALEIELLCDLVASPVGEVVCFAPVNHIFGFLCGLMLARGYRARLISCPHVWDMSFVDVTLRKSRVIVSLPATWHVLVRSSLLRPAKRRSVVLHSAGAIPRVGREAIAAARRTNAEVVEILGSAETGAIACRRNDVTGDAAWELIGDVALSCSAANALRIASPRCGAIRADDLAAKELRFVETDDVVESVGERRFRLLGRRSRTAKVNGVNVNLDRLEQSLEPALPSGWAVHLVAEPDAVRGEAFYALAAPAAGASTARPELENLVCATVSRTLGSRMHPLRFVYVDHLPRTITGKPIIRRDGDVIVARDCDREATGRGPAAEPVG